MRTCKTLLVVMHLVIAFTVVHGQLRMCAIAAVMPYASGTNATKRHECNGQRYEKPNDYV